MEAQSSCLVDYDKIDLGSNSADAIMARTTGTPACRRDLVRRSGAPEKARNARVVIAGDFIAA
jgi:hypothetical protein